MIPDERIEKVMDRYVDFLLKEMDKPEASLVEINDGIRLLERNKYILKQFANKSPAEQGEAVEECVRKALQEGIEKSRVPYD